MQWQCDMSCNTAQPCEKNATGDATACNMVVTACNMCSPSFCVLTRLCSNRTKLNMAEAKKKVGAMLPTAATHWAQSNVNDMPGLYLTLKTSLKTLCTTICSRYTLTCTAAPPEQEMTKQPNVACMCEESIEHDDVQFPGWCRNAFLAHFTMLR